MSLFWMLLMPAFLLFVGGIVFYAVQLKFFSSRTRDLDQIDIANEVGEIRLSELEMLVSQATDVSNLAPEQRRQALAQRLQNTIQWLHLIVSNATLFQEVARFHIQGPATPHVGSLAEIEGDDLPFRVMDRASVVRFVAAACLIKLRLVEFCRILLPAYVPAVAIPFPLRGYDLRTWYPRLAKEMLQLAKQNYDDAIYARLNHQLTGLFPLEKAS